MLEVGIQKFHEKNWKEPLRKVAGDTLKNNSFMHMLSNAMVPNMYYKEFYAQFTIHYIGDVAVCKTKTKNQLVEFFRQQFTDSNKDKIRSLTNRTSGIKALSLMCEEIKYHQSTREQTIISSVLFEYDQNGALIHYLATTSMKKSSFAQQFVLKELTDNNLETYINNQC